MHLARHDQVMQYLRGYSLLRYSLASVDPYAGQQALFHVPGKIGRYVGWFELHALHLAQLVAMSLGHRINLQ
jgi:hypothetical protein